VGKPQHGGELTAISDQVALPASGTPARPTCTMQVGSAGRGPKISLPVTTQSTDARALYLSTGMWTCPACLYVGNDPYSRSCTLCYGVSPWAEGAGGEGHGPGELVEQQKAAQAQMAKAVVPAAQTAPAKCWSCPCCQHAHTGLPPCCVMCAWPREEAVEGQAQSTASPVPALPAVQALPMSTAVDSSVVHLQLLLPPLPPLSLLLHRPPPPSFQSHINTCQWLAARPALHPPCHHLARAMTHGSPAGSAGAVPLPLVAVVLG
jgi:hypothetical protein